MFSKRFEKKAFKAAVKDNVKTLYRKTIDEATPQQLFQAGKRFWRCFGKRSTSCRMKRPKASSSCIR